MLVEPLLAHECKRLIRDILENGRVRFSSHAREELAKDGKSEIDAVNVLRGGVVQPGEWENGSWRYRVMTPRMAVVVAFRAEDLMVVVTAWRIR